MTINKNLLLTIISFILPFLVAGQYKSVSSFDHYLGINKSVINPSFTEQTPNKWEVTLVNAGHYLSNDYSFITKESLISSLINLSNLKLVDSLGQNTNQKGIIGFTGDGSDKYADTNVDILGPSVLLKRGKYAFGFYTRMRAMALSESIPRNLSYFNFANFSLHNNQLNVEPVSISAGMMNEYAIHASMPFKEKRNGYWSVGGNLKLVNGYDAAQFDSEDRLFLEVRQDTLIFSQNLFNLAFSTGAEIHFEGDGTGYNFKRIGSGIGLDIGISYIKEDDRTLYKELPNNYRFKVGFSLLDLGYINYKRKSYDFNLYSNGGILSVANLNDFPDVVAYVEDISKQLTGDLETDENYKMGLPTMFSLQSDYYFRENWAFSVLLMQRIPMFKYSLKRTNIFSMQGRYEKKMYTLGGSVSVRNYKNFQLGAYARFGPFFIGSDQILPVAIPQKTLDSYDIYVGISLFPFLNKRCKCEE